MPASQQPLDVALAEARDPLEVEPGERPPEVLALAQDRQPGEARLKPLEAELLEQPPVVVRPGGPIRASW